MKLTLKNCPDPTVTELLKKTFKVTLEALGVYPFAVEVETTLAPEEFEVIPVYNGQRLSAKMGETDAHIRGNVAYVRLYAFNTPQLVETFAHELTHVAQDLRGDLKCGCEIGGGAIWKGKHYSDYRCVTEYENLPWEIEARAVGAQIARRILQ